MTPARDRARLGSYAIFHGAVVTAIGLLAGIPFALAIVHGWGDASVGAWRVSHTAGVTLGLMALVIGAVLHRLRLGRRAALALTFAVVLSAYAFAVGTVLAAALGARGLSARGPANAVVLALYLVGLATSLVAVGFTILGACGALGTDDAEAGTPPP